MPYVRERSRELTGFQDSKPFSPAIDIGCDFAMVYGTDDGMPERIRQFRQAGYAVHLMTGIAWGDYQEYLDGRWDGLEHFDEGQKERSGAPVNHGTTVPYPTVPYMVPSVAFADYLTQRLKRAVDCGVEAIHMEEPEFWDRSGYSEAFRREYELRYHELFKPQHEDVDAHWRCARLKAELYARTLDRVSAALKEYAFSRYGRELRFYVPTHSILNYCQWKIVSPEASLLDLSTVDGYIAQVWTGTARVANVYEGVYKERVFETALLEYGAMQELARGTGRRMWFLHDPIEDNPAYTWEDYRASYLDTLIASLLHPEVGRYEACTWPTRVFTGVYPRVQPRAGEKDETGFGAHTAKPIPDSYRSFLSGVFQLLGDMEQPSWAFEDSPEPFGVFLSDSCLYQRSFPDSVPAAQGFEEELYRLIIKQTKQPDPQAQEEMAARSRAAMKALEGDEEKLRSFISCAAFPHFYGLTLPLLKYGLPIRPIQLDNVRRFPGYLKDIHCAALSYEFMKPLSPDISLFLAEWVRSGGRLIVVGNGSDPFHAVRAWWREAGYENPMQHLFETLGMPREAADVVYPFGKGKVYVRRVMPASLCLTKANADAWRRTVKAVIEDAGEEWAYRNHITLRRGPYVICHIMDESVSGDAKTFTGRFIDLMDETYPLIRVKTVRPGESALLYDLDKTKEGKFAVLASAARISGVRADETALRFRARAALDVQVSVRLALPFIPSRFEAESEGQAVPLVWEYDDETHTVLLRWRSKGVEISVEGIPQRK